MRYSVQRHIGQAWVDEQTILPLLDGLDEVAPDHRDGCVEAINTFKQQYDLRTVVCSRLEEYQALSGKLHMQSAVVVQPLMPEDIGRYLDGAGDRLVGIREVYNADNEWIRAE